MGFEVNALAAGGRVIFTNKMYDKANIHDELLTKAKESDVANFDWLYLRMGRYFEQNDDNMIEFLEKK